MFAILDQIVTILAGLTVVAIVVSPVALMGFFTVAMLRECVGSK